MIISTKELAKAINVAWNGAYPAALVPADVKGRKNWRLEFLTDTIADRLNMTETERKQFKKECGL